MNRSLAMCFCLLFLLTVASVAQTTQADPLQFDPSIPASAEEQRDMQAFGFLSAVCITNNYCPTLSVIKNIPDGNILSELPGGKGYRKIWDKKDDGNNWRRFLSHYDIPEPENKEVQNRFLIIFTNHEEKTGGPEGIFVSQSNEDKKPLILFIFDRSIYSREHVKDVPFVSLRGKDFLETWTSIVNEINWVEKQENCDPSLGQEQKTCEERGRARVELLGRIVSFAWDDKRLNFLLYGDDKHKRHGPQLALYNHCLSDKFPEETEIDAKMGKISADTFLASLIERGVPKEEATKKAELVRSIAQEEQTEIEKLMAKFAEDGMSDDEAREKAAAIVTNKLLSETLPEALKNQEISSCALLVWDYEELSLESALRVSEKFREKTSGRIAIVPSGMIGYLSSGDSKDKAGKNWLRREMRRLYGNMGVKALFYQYFWDRHK